MKHKLSTSIVYILSITISIVLFYFVASSSFIAKWSGKTNDNEDQTADKKVIPDNPAMTYTINRKVLADIKAAPTDYVLRYVNLPMDVGWGSNAIPLVISALITEGPMLELGTGFFSTPILHKIAVDQNRKLTSVDTNIDWLKKFVIYNSTNNHKVYALSQTTILTYGSDRQWGLVLIDHIVGDQRYLNAISLAKQAQIVILHDAEKMNEYGYVYEKNKVRSYYKYACKYSLKQTSTGNGYISTLLLSNFIAMDEIELILRNVKTDYGHVACDLNY